LKYSYCASRAPPPYTSTAIGRPGLILDIHLRHGRSADKIPRRTRKRMICSAFDPGMHVALNALNAPTFLVESAHGAPLAAPARSGSAYTTANTMAARRSPRCDEIGLSVVKDAASLHGDGIRVTSGGLG
jgi:hypothetical protein